MALTYDQIQALTNKYVWPKITDATFKSNATFNRLYNKKRFFDGGEFISLPIISDVNQSQGSYSGYDTLAVNPNEQFTAVRVDWKQLYSAVSMSGTEQIKNSGKNAIINLLKSKRDNAIRSLKTLIGTQIHGDGTGNSGKDFDGLKSIVGSGSYGGINPADVPSGLWKAQVDNTTNTLTLSAMTKLFGAATEDADQPKFGITTQDVLDKYESLLQPQQRYTSSVEVDGGFHALKFKGIPIIADSHCPGSGGGTTDNYLYFLNDDYLFLGIHPDRDFKQKPQIDYSDKDAFVEFRLVAGNLICVNRRFQAVMTALDPNL